MKMLVNEAFFYIVTRTKITENVHHDNDLIILIKPYCLRKK